MIVSNNKNSRIRPTENKEEMGGGEEEEGDDDEAEKDEEKDEEEETEKKKNRARYTATPVACGVRVGSGRINH